MNRQIVQQENSPADRFAVFGGSAAARSCCQRAVFDPLITVFTDGNCEISVIPNEDCAAKRSSAAARSAAWRTGKIGALNFVDVTAVASAKAAAASSNRAVAATSSAAESTGAMAGLGMRIRSLNNAFETKPMLLYIIIIGVIGIVIEKLIKLLERRLTSWQEKREI